MSVATVVEEDVPVEIRTIGTVEAYAAVTVKPQVSGQILEVHFTEGRDVAPGDLLFTIDPRPFQADLRKAEANLAKDTALAKDAELEAARNADLFNQGQAAQREYEKSRAAADALQASVQADAAAVENAGLQLEYCSIRSPIIGVTGRLLADRGNIVKANETVLLMINRVSPIYVALDVPEQHLASINRYRSEGELKVHVTIAGDDGSSEAGLLSFVNNEVDSTTGTIGLRATFANQDRRLWPGQFVNVVLTLTTQPGTVVVPSQAIQTGQSGPYAFVVKDDLTAESRPVMVGFTREGQTVVEKGLLPGERVVTDGHLRVVPGGKVEVKEAASSGDKAGS